MVVHPVDHGHRGGGGDEETGGGVRRLKVRMTSGQLKELMAEMMKEEDCSLGNKRLCYDSNELGRLVVRECLKGRLHARLVSPHLSTSGNNIGLSTIQEHDDENEDHHQDHL